MDVTVLLVGAISVLLVIVPLPVLELCGVSERVGRGRVVVRIVGLVDGAMVGRVVLRNAGLVVGVRRVDRKIGIVGVVRCVVVDGDTVVGKAAVGGRIFVVTSVAVTTPPLVAITSVVVVTFLLIVKALIFWVPVSM